MTQPDTILIVDPQVDFCPGGALAVPDGDRIMAVLNRVMDGTDLPVVVSRDWHPPGSAHFQRWPAHCVSDTTGASFHPALELPADAAVVSKGMDPEDDGGYSAFEGTVLASGASLGDHLREVGARHLLVGGLATDYCVRATVLDALRDGLEVTVLADAVRGIDAKPGDMAMAVAEMASAGARFVQSGEIVDTGDDEQAAPPPG